MNRHQVFAFLSAAAGQIAVMLGAGIWGSVLAVAATGFGIISKADNVSQVTGAIQRKLSKPDPDFPEATP